VSTIVGAIVLAILAGFGIAIVGVRSILTPLHTVYRVAEELKTAADQVGAASQSLSQVATEQASSAEETSSSVEEMAASVSTNSDNAKVTGGIA
jgi:methyl-accepting chemotaxis protein